MRTNPLKFSGARRLMNVFRFCRRNLTALPVFLVFMACDQLLPTSGNGELVPVKIRSVSVKGYGEVSATRSAGGEKRIVGEPIVQDLGGGQWAEITVEEDVSALRAATQLGSSSNPVKFRVIAVNSSDGKVYSYADYTVSSTIDKVGNSPELHVVSGGSYYFVCISYNNNTLPPAPELNAALGNVAVTAGNDLLWQKTDAKPITGEVNLEFKELKHRLAVVKLVFNAQSASKTISSVDNSKITLGAVGTEGSFDLTGGSVSKITASNNSLTFGGWGATGSQTLESGEIRFIPQATGNYTLTIKKDAVTFSSSETALAQTIPIACSKFEAEKRYTIQLKVVPDTRIGYFGGALVKTNDVWQFERELYVQNADASTSIEWSTNKSTEQGGTDETHGKANTLALYKNSYTNPAATLCFQKNTNYASITATSDADYIWYLPAQKQLMAIWVVHNSFKSVAKFSSDYYWSSTESTSWLSWSVTFKGGTTNSYFKTNTYLARCVREV